jgi:hypothetical protein
MRSLCPYIVALSLLSETSILTAQATAPRNPTTQSTLPPGIGLSTPQTGLGQTGIGNSGIQDSNQPDHSFSNLSFNSGSVSISESLKDMSDMLALLMTDQALKGLLAYEDKQYGDDLTQKLAHRKAALMSAIQGRVAACK